MVTNKIDINAALAQRLVAAQFPQWASLEVRSVDVDGHDNRTFRLGDGMSIRLPSHERYSTHVTIEHEWLSRLARQLPLSIPEIIGKGGPTDEYPWPWTLNKWLPGDIASAKKIIDVTAFAKDLANFLNALQSIDATDAPAPGQHNFFRGGDLLSYDRETRESIDTLSDEIDVRAAVFVWESALSAKYHGSPVWIHGDVAVGNLLVQDGRLSAVIDFGQLAAGDPSCDTTMAWTFFSGASRKVFEQTLSVDATTWARGKGWCLWKALLTLRSCTDKDSEVAAAAKAVIVDLSIVDSPIHG